MERTERILSNAEGVDAIVLMNGTSPFLDPTFWYVTEQRSGTFEGTIAVISKDGTLNVIVNRLEEMSAKGGKGNIHVYEKREERNSILNDILKGSETIGMNFTNVTYAAAEYVKTVTGREIKDVSKAISKTMAIKDAKEIGSIRKACQISSNVASSLQDIIEEGMSEKEVSAEIDERMRKAGADGNAFETIAAFGEFSAEPHHRPSGRRLKKGDVALFDFGCKYEMYCSDLTRTLFMGDPDERLIKAYDIVFEAKRAGMDMIRDGVNAKDVDMAARNIIDDSEFKGMFIHSFGHGIGMSVHENISISHISDDVLKENMIVSAEPGIYIPGVGGIRIEDTVLVKNGECESLTRSDQNITVIR